MAALCTLDIDSFKAINDEYGHPAGDAVLLEFSRRLRKNIRTNDQIGRIGGDEFWVILNGIDSSKDLASAAQKLVDCCNEPCKTDQHLISFSTSVGIAVTRKKSLTVKEWISRSDEALYAAKNAGKKCWRIYSKTSALDNRHQEGLMEQEIRENFS
jgi:diguanylate cyclase (GGDEF)-like protein